jgi:hypothetical protein
MLDHQHISNTHINASNGYWSVGEEIFFSKISAMIKAHSTKQRVKFHFNDHIYNTVNWNIEPQESLQQLYLQRALELRDQHDYLIILYSAGSDSTNMIKTFIDNNIKIDHVASWGCKNHHWGDLDLPNIEITKAGSEMIKKIINMGIKFTFENLLDTEIFKKEFRTSDWAYRAGPTLSIGSVMKHLAVFQKKDYLELTKKGKKVCFLWGMERARPQLIRGNYYLNFNDQILKNQSTASRSSPNYSIPHEYFYSGPDTTSTKILAKQAHLILNYCEKNFTKQQIERILGQPKQEHLIGPDPHRELHMLVNDLIYPDTWDNKTFTVGKPAFDCMDKPSKPFLHDKTTPEFKIWQGGVSDVLNNIDSVFKESFETTGSFFPVSKFQFVRAAYFKDKHLNIF